MKNISIRLGDGLTELLERHCKQNGVTQTHVITTALKHYLGSASADPLQHVLDHIDTRFNELIAATRTGQKTKSATLREAAPRREASVTADGSAPDRMVVLHAAREKVAYYKARNLRPQWKQIAAELNEAGLFNQKGGEWQGDTIRNLLNRNPE
ncbi:hypothetical protein SP695_004644 [Salmonella enterica]|nr:hypothetical protein [Salmonella enterica]